MASLWLTIGSLSLGETRRFLMVLPPLKWVWRPYLPQIFLMLSQNLVYRVWQCDPYFWLHCVSWAPVVPPSVTCLVDLLGLSPPCPKTHLGYLHLVRAFLRWSFSCWSSSGLLDTMEALWERVWIALNLAERWWWLSHCKYWSVWVGFVHSLYTICHLWCGQGACQNPKTLGWQVPTQHKQYPRLCGTGQTHHLGTWRMSQFLWCVCPCSPQPQ